VPSTVLSHKLQRVFGSFVDALSCFVHDKNFIEWPEPLHRVNKPQNSDATQLECLFRPT
jgi:hypothetical protein